jgi:hypothetical protein
MLIFKHLLGPNYFYCCLLLSRQAMVKLRIHLRIAAHFPGKGKSLFRLLRDTLNSETKCNTKRYVTFLVNQILVLYGHG